MKNTANFNIVARLAHPPWRLFWVCFFSFPLPGLAVAPAVKNYLYTGPVRLKNLAALIQRSEIQGVQVLYSWKMLETAPGAYDFSPIERDLRFLRRRHKKLFVQLQDRFFSRQARRLPAYLLRRPRYGGGLAPEFARHGRRLVFRGWVAAQWNPAVRRRFQRLLAALARRFDGRVAGINLPESSIEILAQRTPAGFSCGRYFRATEENIAFARRVFRRSAVVQYVNFWPCGWSNHHRYMSRFFAFARRRGIGLGGPDVVPYLRGQMRNSYRFFHRYRGRLPLVAMAVQEPDLKYLNPKTRRPFTQSEFAHFAQNYLGARIIFWTTQAPWWRPQH